MWPGTLRRVWPFLRFYPLWLSRLAFLFLSSIELKLTSFLDFMSILFAIAWNYPRCPAFFFNFWRVEVKVTCCTLEVFHELGFFCAFTLWFSCLAFLFLSSIALKLTSFLDFISIFSAVAWNYPTCQAFFYFWRVEVKVTCCSLEVFHEPCLFWVFTLWLSGWAFLFLSPTALKLTSFLDFICWSVELSYVPGFFFLLFLEG